MWTFWNVIGAKRRRTKSGAKEQSTEALQSQAAKERRNKRQEILPQRSSLINYSGVIKKNR